jgi:hypothetical protein
MSEKESRILGGIGLGQEKRYDTMKEVLYTDNNLEMITDLSKAETAVHSIVVWADQWIADMWDVDLNVRALIKLKEKRLVSKNRLGRSEATEILKEAGIDQEKKANDIKKLVGL